MCILLKLHYAIILDCFVQNLSKKNLWGVGSTPPPLGKGRVKKAKDAR